MLTPAMVAKRINDDRAHLVVAMIILLAGAVLVGTIVVRSTGGEAISILPTGPDVSTLALDRYGADLFAPPNRYASDTTELALDRNGADTLSVLVGRLVDVTDLNLDRDGADIP